MGERTERVVAVDLLRGISISLMLLVNYPGDKLQIWGQLRHHPFPGVTLADLVFPLFLFIVGVSIALSESRRAMRGVLWRDTLLHGITRAAKLFILGCVLLSISYQTVRFNLGTLQRIALCYLIALLFSRSSRWIIVAAIISILGLQQFLECVVRAPGTIWEARWIPGQMFTEWLDTLILGKPRSEGVLTTLSATNEVMLGLIAGQEIVERGFTVGAARRILIASTFVAALGILLSAPQFSDLGFYSPMHQRYWTPSYALFTGGISGLLLVICAEVAKRCSAVWLRPFVVLGANAITIFVFANIFNRICSFEFGESGSFKLLLNSLIGPTVLSPYLYPAIVVLVSTLLANTLYRRKIFFKL